MLVTVSGRMATRFFLVATLASVFCILLVESTADSFGHVRETGPAFRRPLQLIDRSGWKVPPHVDLTEHVDLATCDFPELVAEMNEMPGFS